MENTKIFIDIDDEIPFVSERVQLATTAHVILVIPEKALLLSTLAGLKLLAASIEKSGKRVVIVTMDDTGRMLAERAGFFTKTRVGEVDNTLWSQFPGAEDVAMSTKVEKDGSGSSYVREPEKEISLGEVKQINPSVEAISAFIQDEPKEEEQIGESSMAKPTKTVVDEKVVDIVESQKDQTEKKEVNIEEKKINMKYVASSKVINLGSDFELFVGGDVAVLQKSREADQPEVDRKAVAINTLLSDEPEGGIIGSDLEAHISKKKNEIS